MILPETYYIEYLYANKVTSKDMQFKCKWKDWPKKQSTWEPLPNILYGSNNKASVMKYLKTCDYNLFYGLNKKEKSKKLNLLHCNTKQVEMINEKQSRQKIKEKIKESLKIKEMSQSTVKLQNKKAQEVPLDILENQESQQPTTEQCKQSPSDLTKQLQWSSQSKENEQECLNKLKLMISQLSYEDQMFFYDEMNYNSDSQLFEYLFQVINLDNNSKAIYTLNKLKLQYLNIGLVKPIKKQEEEEEIIKPKKIELKNKHKLIKQSEQQIRFEDFELSMNRNNQIFLIQPQIDTQREYGQIGFDRVFKFCSHQYGLIAGAQNEGLQLQLFFEAQFFEKEQDYQPRNSFVTQRQAYFYEREKYEEYINQNLDLFSFMIQEV